MQHNMLHYELVLKHGGAVGNDNLFKHKTLSNESTSYIALLVTILFLYSALSFNLYPTVTD